MRNMNVRSGMSRRQFMGAVGAGAAGLVGAAMMGSGTVSAAKGYPLYGMTLKQIRTKGKLRAGYVNGWEGPGFNNGSPDYIGYSTDYIRFFTVAAFSGIVPNITAPGVVDNYWKMIYGTGSNSRGEMLINDQVDVVDCQITMTLARDAKWGAFTATTLYDGGSLMWNKEKFAEMGYPDFQITTLDDLATLVEQIGEVKIGYESDTTAEGYIPQLATLYSIKPVPYAGDPNNNPNNYPLFYDQAFSDLANGNIHFIASDETYLRLLRVLYDGDHQSLVNWEIAPHGPLALSEEPLTPMTRGDDENWTSIVKWCIYATFAATELGITKSNVDYMMVNGSSEAKKLLGAELSGTEYLPEKLGLNRYAFANAIKVVGAWHEIWDRNMVVPAPLGLSLSRGYPNEIPPNGLFFSPVFGGSQ